MFFGQVGEMKQARGVDGCVAAYAQGGDCRVDNRNEDADLHSGTEPLQCAREAYAQACVAAYAQAFPEAPGRSGCGVDNRK